MIKLFCPFLLIFAFFSSSVFAKTASLEHCNLSFAAPSLKQKIEHDVKGLSDADLKTFEVTIKKKFRSYDPVIERSDFNADPTTFTKATLTGYYSVEANVTLRDGRLLFLNRDSGRFTHGYGKMNLEIWLVNIYNYEDGSLDSNYCLAKIDNHFSDLYWAYIDPDSKDPIIKYHSSNLEGMDGFERSEGELGKILFEPTEPPQVGY